MRRTAALLTAGAFLAAGACADDEQEPTQPTIDFNRQGHIPDDAWQEVPLTYEDVCDNGVEFDGSTPEGSASVARANLVDLAEVGIVWVE